MLWIWIALMSPASYLFGFARGYPYNKFAVVITFLAVFFDKARRKPYIDTHVVLLGLFLIQLSVSYYFALSDTGRADELYDRITKIILLSAVMLPVVRDRFRIYCIVFAICLGLGIHGTLEGLRYLSTGC